MYKHTKNINKYKTMYKLNNNYFWLIWFFGNVAVFKWCLFYT